MDPQRLRAAAADAVGLLKILGNPERLLLSELSRGELCVSDLEQELEIRQPTLSQQLAVLRREGAVETRREGKNIYYRVSDPKLLQVLKLLYRLYCTEE